MLISRKHQRPILLSALASGLILLAACGQQKPEVVDTTGVNKAPTVQVPLSNPSAIEPQQPVDTAGAQRLAAFIAEANPPPDSDVPVTPSANVPLVFSGSNAPFSNFRTRLKQAATEGVNFAGHYKIAVVGCGTGCTFGWVIDLTTGQIYDLGLGGEDMQQLSLSFKPDSRYIRAVWIEQHPDLSQTCVAQAFVWDGNKLQSLGEKIATPAIDDGCPSFDG